MVRLQPVIALILVVPGPAAQDPPAEEQASATVTGAEARVAGTVVGLPFTDPELELMVAGVGDHLEAYETLRSRSVPNELEPALRFDPLVAGVTLREPWVAEVSPIPVTRARPGEAEELLFLSIPELAGLLRAGETTCVELTELSLARLERLDARLECVITLLPERALAMARRLDEEAARGDWRGLLHGIPWGAKDLLAVAGAPTTWGAMPYRDQVLDHDATVVERLDAAGAVLVAKLTLGALAWGDVWFGGKTRNPWNPEQGSSGSSAGSASATAAGAVVFAIGSETYGSIVSPSDRCGTTGLRPTFGRVSRHGAMALSWSLDKLGPITRSVTDAGLVLEAVAGGDPRDRTVVDLPFAAPGPADVAGWRVGVVEGSFDDHPEQAVVLEQLRSLGVELVPVTLPAAPVDALMFVLEAEAASAFDDLTRDGRDDLLVRQIEQAWPNVFRAARLIPAVEYLRAQRLRTRLCRELDEVFDEVVAFVHPSFAGQGLPMTNLTGHPAVVAPCGARDDGTPFSVTFTGRLYDEARLLALAGAWQGTTDVHLRRPPLD